MNEQTATRLKLRSIEQLSKMKNKFPRLEGRQYQKCFDNFSHTYLVLKILKTFPLLWCLRRGYF